MKFIKSNIKVVIAFIFGVVLSGAVVYATVTAASVTYDNSISGLKKANGADVTNAQEALDALTVKANNIVPIDPNTFNTNSAKTVYASSKGVCIKRNGILNCFKVNNWAEEQTHIQSVFSDISCHVESSDIDCIGSDFHCIVDSDGYVYCDDDSDGCGVLSNGSVSCD